MNRSLKSVLCIFIETHIKQDKHVMWLLKQHLHLFQLLRETWVKCVKPVSHLFLNCINFIFFRLNKHLCGLLKQHGTTIFI